MELDDLQNPFAISGHAGPKPPRLSRSLRAESDGLRPALPPTPNNPMCRRSGKFRDELVRP